MNWRDAQSHGLAEVFRVHGSYHGPDGTGFIRQANRSDGCRAED